MRKLPGVAAFLLIAAAGLMAYVRFAPVDPGLWHVDLATNRPAEMRFTLFPPGSDPVIALRNGGYFDLYLSPTDARTLLARLDAVAHATPRTRTLAGNAASGHITWETRSLIWGFPDYTTVQLTRQGMTAFARQRFGSGDGGVNANRLRDWLSRL